MIQCHLARPEFLKLLHYANVEPSLEVGGLGWLDPLQRKGAYRVTDPVILKQTVSPGSVDLDGPAVQEFLEAHWTDEELFRELPEINLFLWHTHGKGGVFHSTVDDNWISRYVGRGVLVSACFNTLGKWDIEAHTKIGTDPETTVQAKINASLIITDPSPFSDEELVMMDAEYADLVSKKPIPKKKPTVQHKGYVAKPRGENPHIDGNPFTSDDDKVLSTILRTKGVVSIDQYVDGIVAAEKLRKNKMRLTFANGATQVLTIAPLLAFILKKRFPSATFDILLAVAKGTTYYMDRGIPAVSYGKSSQPVL